MRLSLFGFLAVSMLGSCLSSGNESARSASGATGSLAATSGTVGNHGQTASGLIPIGSIESPEERLVEQQRLYSVRSIDGRVERFREIFQSDGNGNFLLKIVDYSPDLGLGFAGAGASWDVIYDWRQRFLVHFRDIHVGDEAQVHRNYVWRPVAGNHQVAGRDVARFLATSRHGLGSIEIDVDRQENVILAWTVRDENGEVDRQLITETISFTPNFNTVNWSESQPEQPYRGPVDDPLLGFTPRMARYVPDGFESERTVVVLAQQVFPTLAENLHAEYLSDGLQYVIIAQQGHATPWTPAGSVIHTSDSCGVHVVDGNLADRNIFVVGPGSTDELLAVLGSMMP